jgi:PEP-CTERM motif-containing protein
MSILFAAYRPATAANIVLNGGFETGTLPSWTLTNPEGDHTTITAADAHTGSYAVSFGNVNSDATLAQTLSDVIGVNYTFSFWLETFGDSPSDFSAKFDTTVLLGESNPVAVDYTQFSYNVVGTGSDTISFLGSDGPDEILLDDVSVVDNSSPTPEPSTLVLAGLGCVGLLARYRTRESSLGPPRALPVGLTGFKMERMESPCDETETPSRLRADSGRWLRSKQ